MITVLPTPSLAKEYELQAIVHVCIVAYIILFKHKLCHLFRQLLRVVAMGPFDWVMDGPLMKAEWRSASMECGGQCVVIAGGPVMPEWSADS